MSGDGFVPMGPGTGARAGPAAAARPGFAALHSTRWLQFLVLVGPALAVLLAIYLYPLGKLLALSFGGVEPSAAAYRKFFESPLYLAILAPLFWVPRLRINPAALRRALLLLWAFHTVSAGFGILQVYFPGRFQPNLSTMIVDAWWKTA